MVESGRNWILALLETLLLSMVGKKTNFEFNFFHFKVKCGSIFTKKSFIWSYSFFTRLFKNKNKRLSLQKRYLTKEISSKAKSGVFTKYLLLFERQYSNTIKTKTKRSQFEEAKWNNFFVIQFDRIFSLFYKFSSVIWGLFHQKSIPTWTWEADEFRFTNFPTQTLLKNQVFHF